MESKETLVVAVRAGRPEHTPEAEPVVIVRQGARTLLLLDDGERLEFDELELRRAVGAPADA